MGDSRSLQLLRSTDIGISNISAPKAILHSSIAAAYSSHSVDGSGKHPYVFEHVSGNCLHIGAFLGVAFGAMRHHFFDRFASLASALF